MREPKTKLTLESYGKTCSWEIPYEDATMEDLLYAFYGLCVSATWIPNIVLTEMKNFSEEQLSVLSVYDENSPEKE